MHGMPHSRVTMTLRDITEIMEREGIEPGSEAIVLLCTHDAPRDSIRIYVKPMADEIADHRKANA